MEQSDFSNLNSENVSLGEPQFAEYYGDFSLSTIEQHYNEQARKSPVKETQPIREK